MISAFSSFNLGVMLAIVTVTSVIIFLTAWAMMNIFYLKTSRKWLFIDRFISNARRKGESRLVRRYGLFGLALMIAVPLPTMGVFGGTLLSWLMGMKFWSSLTAIIAGATVSNGIVLLSAFGVKQALGLGG